MKAIELSKHSPTLDKIYDDIQRANERNEYKVFYPHFVYFSDACMVELIKQGFKVYRGEWFHGDHGLIIEW